MYRCGCLTTRIRRAVPFALCAILLGGCGSHATLFGLKDSARSPRIRMSSYASATVGTPFGDPDHLGTHGYRDGRAEHNGIIYTCRAGHLDMPHVRKAADWTAYLAEETFEKLRQGERRFSFKLWEPSRYFVRFDYPDGWNALPQIERDRIARDIATGLGQYFAFTALTWHEVLTWLGYAPVPWYPEFPSAFSWEDTFSNLLGVYLAGQALRDTEHGYDEAMTEAIDRELRRLGVQPKSTAIHAAEKVKGLWYSGDLLFFVRMKRRNLDIGLNDGYVTPWIVPGLEECPDAEPQPYPIPTLDVLHSYGFAMKLEIEPREFQKRKILGIVYRGRGRKPRRLEPAVHFAPIMEYIRQDAVRRYGPNADRPD